MSVDLVHIHMANDGGLGETLRFTKGSTPTNPRPLGETPLYTAGKSPSNSHTNHKTVTMVFNTEVHQKWLLWLL